MKTGPTTIHFGYPMIKYKEPFFMVLVMVCGNTKSSAFTWRSCNLEETVSIANYLKMLGDVLMPDLYNNGSRLKCCMTKTFTTVDWQKENSGMAFSISGFQSVEFGWSGVFNVKIRGMNILRERSATTPNLAANIPW